MAGRICGGSHPGPTCDALRIAAAAGAQAGGAPRRLQGAYLEARQAFRANAPAVAVRILQWLLSHLAESRGVRPEATLSTKVSALESEGLVSGQMRPGLIERALSSDPGPETAWALMTLVEHALARLVRR